MAQKLTLTEYLRRRGAIKALTRIEAEAFGIPWPLQSGWPAKFAGMEITTEMLVDLQGRMASAKQSTVKKARRGLSGVAETVPIAEASAPSRRASLERCSSVPDFVLRTPRRVRLAKGQL